MGCNRQQLSMHYIYRLIVGVGISTVSASMMIKSHSLYLFLQASSIHNKAINVTSKLYIPQIQGLVWLYKEPRSSYNQIKDFGVGKSIVQGWRKVVNSGGAN